MPTIQKPPVRTQRRRMHTLQHQMLPALLKLPTPLLRRLSPSQKHHPLRPLRSHSINHFLRESFPTLLGMGISFVRTHGEAGIEHEDAAIGPGGEEAAIFGWRGEVGVVFFEGDVHVFERGRGRGRWSDGEAEAVGLIDVVVGVLAEDDGFDGGEGRVAGPGWEELGVSRCYENEQEEGVYCVVEIYQL